MTYSWKSSRHMRLLYLWTNLHLSLKGKKIIINHILLSKLWYLAQAIPTPTQFLNNITTIIYDFLWNNKKITVKRATTQLPISQGGLGILNPHLKVQSLLLKWICRLYDHKDTGPWKELFEHFLSQYRKSGQGKETFLTFVGPPLGIPQFYKNILKAWRDLTNNNRPPPSNLEAMLNEPLFFNPHITHPHPTTPNLKMFLAPFKWAVGKISIIADICKVITPGFLTHNQIEDIVESHFPQEQ